MVKLLTFDAVCVIGKLSLFGAIDAHSSNPIGFLVSIVLGILTVGWMIHRASQCASWLLAPPPDPSQIFLELIDIDELRRKEELASCFEQQRARLSGTFT
jgi:hypothetical protein